MTDINKYINGYKFEDDVIKCVECFKAFYDIGESSCPYCKFPIWNNLQLIFGKRSIFLNGEKEE